MRNTCKRYFSESGCITTRLQLCIPPAFNVRDRVAVGYNIWMAGQNARIKPITVLNHTLEPNIQLLNGQGKRASDVDIAGMLKRDLIPEPMDPQSIVHGTALLMVREWPHLGRGERRQEHVDPISLKTVVWTRGFVANRVNDGFDMCEQPPKNFLSQIAQQFWF